MIAFNAINPPNSDFERDETSDSIVKPRRVRRLFPQCELTKKWLHAKILRDRTFSGTSTWMLTKNRKILGRRTGLRRV